MSKDTKSSKPSDSQETQIDQYSQPNNKPANCATQDLYEEPMASDLYSRH